MPKGRYGAQRHIPRMLEDADNGLSLLARRLLHDVYLRLNAMNEQLLAYDRELEHLAKESETAQRLMTIPGVGRRDGDGAARQHRRSQAVPQRTRILRLARAGAATAHHRRQDSSGAHHQARRRLPANAPDPRHAGRAVPPEGKKPDRVSAWSRALIERRGYRRAAVALAAKNARILWALMSRGTTYQLKAA